MPWTYSGSPDYLARQAKRLGISQEIANACKHNSELFTLSTMLSQLCWHLLAAEKARLARTNDNPVGQLPRPEILRQSLERCEVEVKKLHLSAAAADDALGDAYRAFGFDRARKPFEILSDLDGSVVNGPLSVVGAAAPHALDSA